MPIHLGPRYAHAWTLRISIAAQTISLSRRRGSQICSRYASWLFFYQCPVSRGSGSSYIGALEEENVGQGIALAYGVIAIAVGRSLNERRIASVRSSRCDSLAESNPCTDPRGLSQLVVATSLPSEERRDQTLPTPSSDRRKWWYLTTLTCADRRSTNPPRPSRPAPASGTSEAFRAESPVRDGRAYPRPVRIR